MNYLEMASKVALNGFSKENSTYKKEYNFGIVCVRQDGSLTISNNILTATPNPAAHAEYRALAKAGFGATLYIVRLKRDYCWGMAKPCKHCETLIKNKKVKKVVYSIGPNEYGVWYPNK